MNTQRRKQQAYKEERRGGVERDMEIEGDINREKRDLGMTEVDTT